MTHYEHIHLPRSITFNLNLLYFTLINGWKINSRDNYLIIIITMIIIIITIIII